jgi:mRNA interferase MazF
MTVFEVGDVVTVEFPYSDLQGRKRRPGLVLAADESDVLLARITTRSPRDPGDVLLENWPAVGLPKPSTIRLTKLVTVDKRLVLRRVGRLAPQDRTAVLQALNAWLQALGTQFASQ